MNTTPAYSFKSEIGQWMAEGVESIIGPDGFEAVVELARHSSIYKDAGTTEDASFADLTALQCALEDIYGPRGGRGIALRAGRVVFPQVMNRNEDTLGWMKVNFRLQPTPLRLTNGLKDLAGLLSRMCGTNFAVETSGHTWSLLVGRCPFCWQREADEACCQFLTGLVQEFLSWASSGKYHQVAEVECIAAGADACVLQIDKTPLE